MFQKKRKSQKWKLPMSKILATNPSLEKEEQQPNSTRDGPADNGAPVAAPRYRDPLADVPLS